MRRLFLPIFIGLVVAPVEAVADSHYCRDALRQPHEAQFYVSSTPCGSRVRIFEYPSEPAWRAARDAWDHRPTGRACCQRIDGTHFISPAGCDETTLVPVRMGTV